MYCDQRTLGTRRRCDSTVLQEPVAVDDIERDSLVCSSLSVACVTPVCQTTSNRTYRDRWFNYEVHAPIWILPLDDRRGITNSAAGQV